jgi:hypothetical protein
MVGALMGLMGCVQASWWSAFPTDGFNMLRNSVMAVVRGLQAIARVLVQIASSIGKHRCGNLSGPALSFRTEQCPKFFIVMATTGVGIGMVYLGVGRTRNAETTSLHTDILTWRIAERRTLKHNLMH